MTDPKRSPIAAQVEVWSDDIANRGEDDVCCPIETDRCIRELQGEP